MIFEKPFRFFKMQVENMNISFFFKTSCTKLKKTGALHFYAAPVIKYFIAVLCGCDRYD